MIVVRKKTRVRTYLHDYDVYIFAEHKASFNVLNHQVQFVS